ncbi:MAG: acyltransferase [Candidatus Coatesbacteria bacterium]|nr:MAG: acyltransferase [Candidatus Coatesbacteria bacterium]
MRLGIVQFDPEFGKVEKNLRVALGLAGAVEADVYILPELFSTGYQFKDRPEAASYAEELPGGPTTDALESFCRGRGCYVAGGLAEKSSDNLYNSAVLVGPDGFVALYRKTHLFDREKEIYDVNDEDMFRVYDIGFARVGMMICFDWIYPETTRILAVRGAQIVLHMANLVLPYCQAAAVTRAVENRVFVAVANRTGTEDRVPDETLEFTGASVIVSPKGEYLLQAGETDEGCWTVSIDPTDADDKMATPRNHLIDDRRTELYGALVEP